MRRYLLKFVRSHHLRSAIAFAEQTTRNQPLLCSSIQANCRYCIGWRPLSSFGDESKQYRTLYCGDVNQSHEGQSELFSGWVKFTRGINKSQGGFIVLSDHTGDIQLVVPLELVNDASSGSIWKSLTLQSCLSVRGKVVPRPAKDRNPAMKTGDFEVVVEKVIFHNPAKALPFNISKPQSAVRENVRLQYRYLDIRGKEMQEALRLRSSVIHHMRRFLVEQLHFVDIETPTLFRSSPGGAREFLVPSQQPGHFYALTQSPQQLKQLLMVGMVDKYFQIARCYRDEGQFSDRQLEFTQLDLEVSFQSKDFILDTIEKLIVASWPPHLRSKTPSIPFPRLNYEEVFTSYGSDKPDMRYEDIKLVEVTNHVAQLQNEGIQNLIQRGYPAYALVVKKGQLLSRTAATTLIQEVEKEVRWIVAAVNIGQNGAWHKHRFKNLNDSTETVSAINAHLKCENGDLLLVCAGPKALVCTMLGRLRKRFITKLSECCEFYQRDTSDFNFLWVENFPLFTEEKNEKGETVWEACHHPFTAPHQDDIMYLSSDPSKVRGQHFDLVLNGHEIGGGSMRISDWKVQETILKDILKLDYSDLAYLVEALSYGAPVHGGIALGLDRYFAILLNKSSIRDVIAFPKSSTTGACLMSDAPSSIDGLYLKNNYNISVCE